MPSNIVPLYAAPPPPIADELSDEHFLTEMDEKFIPEEFDPVRHLHDAAALVQDALVLLNCGHVRQAAELVGKAERMVGFTEQCLDVMEETNND